MSGPRNGPGLGAFEMCPRLAAPSVNESSVSPHAESMDPAKAPDFSPGVPAHHCSRPEGTLVQCWSVPSGRFGREIGSPGLKSWAHRGRCFQHPTVLRTVALARVRPNVVAAENPPARGTSRMRPSGSDNKFILTVDFGYDEDGPLDVIQKI